MASLNNSFDINGNYGIKPGAAQMFVGKPIASGFTYSDGSSSNAGSSASSGTANAASAGTGSLPARIAAPTLTPFNFSTEAQSYPTYLRNLGEQNAQRAYQASNNRIGMGNSAQNYAHSLDALNTNRLGYMAQAGQEQLGVDKAKQSESDFMNQMYGDLFKTNVGQRGQDVNYMAALAAAAARSASSGGGILRLGGGNSQLSEDGESYGTGTGPQGRYYGLEDQNQMDSMSSMYGGGIGIYGGWANA